MASLDLAQAALDKVRRQASANIDRGAVSGLLEALARHIGTGKLELDQTGTVTITLDDAIEVALTHLPGRPYLIATAPMPDRPESREALLPRLLSSNLDPTLTHGCTFALIPETGALVFCAQVDISGLDVDELDEGLARFVALAEAWQSEIADYLEESGGDDDASENAVAPISPEHYI